MSDVATVEKVLRMKRPETSVAPQDFLSTGSTLVNLACSDLPDGGFAAGHYYHIVGESAAGKTWLCETCCAEAQLNPAFRDYDLYRDETEQGALMDISHFFGQRVSERTVHLRSRTPTEFYANFMRAFDKARKSKRGFIYRLDSENGLGSEAASKKLRAYMKAEDEGKSTSELKGIMSDGKAKTHSQNMPDVVAALADTRSILIVTSQERDNPDAMFDTRTFSGGRSLKFYATLQLWLNIKKHLTRVVNEREREVGVVTSVRVPKNRFTGRARTVLLPIYNTYGIDDIGSMIDFLVLEKHWAGGDKMKVPEFKFEGSRGKLIAHIEDKGAFKDLQEITADCWRDIEDKLILPRKSRYA